MVCQRSLELAVIDAGRGMTAVARTSNQPTLADELRVPLAVAGFRRAARRRGQQAHVNRLLRRRMPYPPAMIPSCSAV